VHLFRDHVLLHFAGIQFNQQISLVSETA
jgi:hypothetical protein